MIKTGNVIVKIRMDIREIDDILVRIHFALHALAQWFRKKKVYSSDMSIECRSID